MKVSKTQIPISGTGTPSQEFRHALRGLERRSTWSWWNTVFVITLLMGAIVVLSLPKLLHEGNPDFQLQLTLAVRGLLGLVLIFNIYVLYQQHKLALTRQRLFEQATAATEERVRAEAFYELAILDPLTGLYNRRSLEGHLHAEISRAERSGDPLTVLAVDLDAFKKINDSFGHATGDLVLKEFAHRLTKAIRASDFAVRLGGDEFLVLLPECPAERVHLVMSRLAPFEIDLGPGRVLVSCSRGWVQYTPPETAEQLIQRADEMLYASKAKTATPALEGSGLARTVA